MSLPGWEQLCWWLESLLGLSRRLVQAMLPLALAEPAQLGRSLEPRGFLPLRGDRKFL